MRKKRKRKVKQRRQQYPRKNTTPRRLGCGETSENTVLEVKAPLNGLPGYGLYGRLTQGGHLHKTLTYTLSSPVKGILAAVMLVTSKRVTKLTPHAQPRSWAFYLANGTWDAISIFLFHLICHSCLLSWLPCIFPTPFRFLCLNLQVSTPLPLGRRHLASPR